MSPRPSRLGCSVAPVKSLVGARDRATGAATGGHTGATRPSARKTGAMTASSLAQPVPLTRDQARAVFGQVKGLVALTLGCLALGAYIGRGVDVGEVQEQRPPGFDAPEGERSYFARASFSDPDGNSWELQEITTRLPGRPWED